MLDVVLLAVGTATAKAVARMWIESDTALDITDGLIERLGARVPALTARRRTSRQFEDMADRIAQQLQPLVEHEHGGLPENEVQAAILGVADVVDSMQQIGPDVLFAIDLEPTALEDLLRQQEQIRVRDDLIPSAQLLFDRVLRENCNYIVELTISMPRFNALALAEVLRRETEISERVQSALERIPQPASIVADADQEFDVQYRRHIQRQLDRLELFGLTLSENSSRYELSIAYITLSVATPSDNAEEEIPERGGPEKRDSGGRGPNVRSGDDTHAESEAYLRVDTALAGGSRHLIRGEAGSGKTTLLQWLAVNAARESFEGDLEGWSSAVPFFLQLRRYANRELPRPEQFLDHTAALIRGVMPPAWVHRQLSTGRALLLIDGVDELPDHQRPAAREWLVTMMQEYPDCRFVVTTRPPAVPEDWLDDSEFALLELLPMSLPDIVSFVQHWHDAARRASAHVAGEAETLNRYQGDLTRVIRESPAIRSLATAPLLCAMLCALNRDRRTQLPRDRMELYRIALESLLDRRDAEREISQNDELSLGLREKETLLQDLSYWLILNEQTDVAKNDAIDRVASRLEFMASINASAARVFAHLLTRSGLIREPVEGRIDFIHRTFQEYLGAARVMSEGNIPLLVQRAHDDQWREVIILSAGHGSVEQRDQLLTGLLERGEHDEALRHRLHLLAVACLETAVELTPATADRVRSALRRALPPTNMTEARAVASAGHLAAPLLTDYTRAYATTTAACVRALCLIGGDAALAALKPFSSDRRVTVIRELIRGWDYFDREEYAREILGSSQLDYGTITLSEVESLAAVNHLQHLRKLTFSAGPEVDNLDELPNLELVTDLVATGKNFSSLGPLSRCHRLKSLVLENASPRITELPAFPDSLTSVVLRYCPSLTDISSLQPLPNFDHLFLRSVPAGIGQIAGSVVRDLHLVNSGTPAEAPLLATFENLRDLSIDGPSAWELGEDGTCSHLATLNQLRDVSLSQAGAIVTLDGLPDSLNELMLYDAGSLVDASVISAATGLQRLALDGAANLTDFDFLSHLSQLRYLDLEGAMHFDDLASIVPNYFFNTLNLSGTTVRDLTALQAFPRLRVVHLNGCPIVTLEPLLRMDQRAWFSIDTSTAALLTDELRAKHRFRVIGVVGVVG